MLGLFIIANLAILAAYTWGALKVAPIIPVTRRSVILFAGFLALCGIGTHGEHVLHALLSPHEEYEHLAREWHMVLIHVVQAAFAWGFMVSFWVDLNRLRRQAP